ncbi:putative bifunctional diguanylate cyclase/phosphodiesterase [Sinorhizobium arboris]|uniref:putative bifunctional diguanylate cyclase/phosphodiesterase n=1 Tax=Sinorhizobium arboris TaxID=76745 RepID=UPI0004093302|nr:EAL domain-containing protein [Sinorhizobium arboris]
MSGEHGASVSFYDDAFQLTSCSERFAEQHRMVSSAGITLWEIYPELLANHRLVVQRVLADGVAREVELGTAPRYSVFLLRAVGGLGVIEMREGSPPLNEKPGSEDDRELLLHQATHDPLTGLPNRRAFSIQLQRLLPSPAGSKFALMQIDLDDFKPVNDTLGHAAGDVVLQMAAERIRGVLTDGDVAYRLAGDEFAIILPRANELAHAEQAAEAVVGAFKEPFAVEGISVFVGASVGVAISPDDGNDSEQLMKAADIALYAAKNDGRRRSRTFRRSMLVILEQREMLRRGLRTALQNDELFIEYQPLLDLPSSISGFEALVRWRHPLAGIVPPAVFIPMAEADGLMGDIGQWVLAEACKQAVKWPQHFRLAVNVSSAEFLREGLPDRIAETLDVTGFPADRLELEITESVLLERNRENLDVLDTLNVLGVEISLDDFGTHYSSLDHLKSFPFDMIKIDRHFIKDLDANEKSRTIVRFVVSLAHGLGMKVTAEGVETADQALWLEQEGCDRLQGYLFGAPMPASAIGDFLKQWSLEWL